MPPTSRVYTSADGLIARVGRAHEDPVEMTAAACDGFRAKFLREAREKNPNLTDEQAGKAADLLMRAHMTRLIRKRWNKAAA